MTKRAPDMNSPTHKQKELQQMPCLGTFSRKSTLEGVVVVGVRGWGCRGLKPALLSLNFFIF